MNESRIVGRIQFAYAFLTCLGGLVLASGTNNEIIPAIAIFFSVFGFLFVDWLRIFSLPPVAAYAAMGLASLYCIINFLDRDSSGNHQMISVSQLLVCVQAVLMLQRKTIRIYEQLAVFCLLELVVAAVFNDALNYGLLLIPICIVGLWALTLLAIATSIDSVDGEFDRLLGASEKAGQETEPNRANMVRFHAAESRQSMANVGIRLPRVVMFSFAPAVLIVSAFFFYALPRTTDAGRVSNRGMAVVGFSDEVRLEQLGQMGQNSQIAARITMRRRPGGHPYQPIAGLYLRGAVLERYRVERTRISARRGARASAVWAAVSGHSVRQDGPLPPEFFPSEFYEDTGDESSDAITVEVTYAASRSPSLFAIPPYYSLDTNRQILHRSDRWTLTRNTEDYHYPRITYAFGTHAFRGGVQCEAIVTGLKTELLATDQLADSDRQENREETLSRTIKTQLERADAEKRWAVYVQESLNFDRTSMPTIKKIADQIAQSSFGDKGRTPRSKPVNDYALAKMLEQHFSLDQQYQYSLNLNAESVIGMDPIEQFVAVDRVGHCQYFASSLAMMLRCQGIPSRVIVGYKTDEYSEIGNQFIARQSHAHAWVEALIDRDELDHRRIGGGQPRSSQYWVRLDPTPSSFVGNDEPTGASKVIDLAQNIWDGLVIDMDSERQVRVLSGKSGSSALSQSYNQFVNRISGAVAKIRAGQLGGGALANFDGFSWLAAIVAAVSVLALVFVGVILRWKPPIGVWRKLGLAPTLKAARPSIDFYADAVDQLNRIGIERADSQTANELLGKSISPIVKPLKVLTSAFYQVRYRGRSLDAAQLNLSQSSPSQSDVDEALEQLTRRVDAIRNGDDTADQKIPPGKT